MTQPSTLPKSKNASLTLADKAYIRLKTDVIMCRLAPGAQFSELELSEHYGMGRAALRSALTRLCEIGLIQSVARRGFVVTPISVKSVTDLFDMRLLIEPNIAKLATPNVDIERIDALNNKPQDAVKESDQLAFLSSNHSFHVAIAEATGNQRATKFVSDLLDESTRLVNLGLYGQGDSAEATLNQVTQDNEHEDLIAAFKKRDSHAAHRAAARHVQSSKDMVLDRILSGGIAAQI